jgi:hypothetical protein
MGRSLDRACVCQTTITDTRYEYLHVRADENASEEFSKG